MSSQQYQQSHGQTRTARIHQNLKQKSNKFNICSTSFTNKYKKGYLLKTLEQGVKQYGVIPHAGGQSQNRTVIQANQEYGFENLLNNTAKQRQSPFQQELILNEIEQVQDKTQNDYIAYKEPSNIQKIINAQGNVNMKPHLQKLQQFNSIQMNQQRHSYDPPAHSQSSQKQTNQLAKMYGASHLGMRKQVKSVERKINEKWIQNNLTAHPPQFVQQINLNNQISHARTLDNRKASGQLNKSMLSAINIYDSLQTLNMLNTSQESVKLKNRKPTNANMDFSAKKKFIEIYSSQEQHRSTSQNRKISSKSLHGRYNQFKTRKTQPLEELKTAFNNNHVIGTKSNAQYITTSESKMIINDFSSSKLNPSTFQTLPHVNSSQGYSGRRIPLKYSINNSKQNLPSSTEVRTIDTVMYLKQQEMLQKSDQLFEHVKNQLLNQNCKNALILSGQAVKINTQNKDARCYKAICYPDESQMGTTDLKELIGKQIILIEAGLKLDFIFLKNKILARLKIQEDTRESLPFQNFLICQIEMNSLQIKNLNIVLSLPQSRENELPHVLQNLKKEIQKFPKYAETVKTRDQINIFLKKWDKSMIDFQKVISLQPWSGQGYFGQADNIKGLGTFKVSLSSYNLTTENDAQSNETAFTQRGIMNYQQKNYDQANKDFSSVIFHSHSQFIQLLKINEQNPKAHYYQGKLMKKQSQYADAILHFEQVLKNNSDEQLAGSALFESAKIRIKQKDFYEAYHNLQRASHYDFNSKKFHQYKTFVEGVLFIMKRKVKRGIKILDQLIEGSATFDAKEQLNANSPPKLGNKQAKTIQYNDKEIEIKGYLMYLQYVYRSYGHIMLGNLEKAFSDLNKASKIRKLDASCIYNKFIVQALIKIDQKDFESVRNILKQAEERFPENKDPYKFQAIAIVQGCVSEVVDIDNPKKKQQMLEAKALMDKALQKSPRDPTLLYLRGLILYYLHDFYEALIDLDAVIDIEEDPTAKHYLARGKCHACLSMFQEAITDLSKALELDDELSDGYFNRGKCAYLLGDTALAFLDFQKLILIEPKNPMVHIYAGNLLMTTGSYEDATKAFSNADSVSKSSLAFFQRARCFIALANMDHALKDLTLVIERTPSDKIAFVDKECLQGIKLALHALNTNQTNQTSSKESVDKDEFAKAIAIFTQLLTTQLEIEKTINTTTSDMRMHQQIIPNVKRIKMDKMRALRRKRAKDEQFQNKKSKKRKPFSLNDQADERLKVQAVKVEPYSYYKERIFEQEDFYLYRGVMNFYIGEYAKAIRDFEDSVKTKQDQKDETNDQDNVSQGSSQTDLSDVGLCSLNVHEAVYNQMLCFLMLADYKQALQKLNQLLQECPKKYQKNLWIIRGLVNQALNNTQKAKSDFDQAQKLDTNTCTEFLQNKENLSFYPFPIGGRLCAQFPDIKFQIAGAPTFFLSKPSFSFPFVKPPNMIPNVDEKILHTEFDMKNIAAPKPEAPWIKRCDYGIKFTDEIQVIDDTQEVSEDSEDDAEESKLDQKKHQKDAEENADTSPREDEYSQNNLDERHYMRNYVKQHQILMMQSQSEKLMRNEFNFFKEFEEDEMKHEDDDSDESSNQIDSLEDAEENALNLYGNQEDQEKQIIVDHEPDESFEKE